MQLHSMSLLELHCLENAHIFLTPRPQFVTDVTFCVDEAAPTENSCYQKS